MKLSSLHWGVIDIQGNDTSGKLENAYTRQQTPQKDSYGKETACNDQNKNIHQQKTLFINNIDSFQQLKSIVLSCHKHEGGATVKEMQAQLTDDLKSWVLQKELLVVIVTDTAP